MIALPLTYEKVDTYLKRIERELMTIGEANNCTWMGITLEWEHGSKKTGHYLKRGKSYGVIRYYYGKEICREEAIREVLKPPELRKAIRDIDNIQICSLCGDISIGGDYLKRWRDIVVMSYKLDRSLGTDAEITLCDTCIMAISKGSDAILERLLRK